MAEPKVLVFEKAFLWTGLILLVLCFFALLYMSVSMGITLPGREGTVDPAALAETPPFDQPGVRQIGPNAYEAVIIGYAWGFEPRQIRVPAGAEVTFVSTSRDVLHGIHVDGTRINVMLVPGQISRVVHTFSEPAEHLMLCHEYCGLAHHAMFGRVIVVDPAEYEAESVATAAR